LNPLKYASAVVAPIVSPVWPVTLAVLVAFQCNVPAVAVRLDPALIVIALSLCKSVVLLPAIESAVPPVLVNVLLAINDASPATAVSSTAVVPLRTIVFKEPEISFAADSVVEVVELAYTTTNHSHNSSSVIDCRIN
jgi:hypothetical protein